MSKVLALTILAVGLLIVSAVAEEEVPSYTIEYFSITVSQLARPPIYIESLSITVSQLAGPPIYLVLLGALPGYYLNINGQFFWLGEARSFIDERGNFIFLPLKTPRISLLAQVPDEYLELLIGRE